MRPLEGVAGVPVGEERLRFQRLHSPQLLVEHGGDVYVGVRAELLELGVGHARLEEVDSWPATRRVRRLYTQGVGQAARSDHGLGGNLVVQVVGGVRPVAQDQVGGAVAYLLGELDQPFPADDERVVPPSP